MAFMAGDQVTLPVRVQPNARRNAIIGLKEGVLYVKLAAPPVEGKANEALVGYLSDLLDTRKSDVSIERGFTGRNKVVAIAGIDRERLLMLLQGAAEPGSH